MKRDKQYAVEVLSLSRHGKYGKTFYFGMYIPAHSKKDAEDLAMETLSEMTFREINERCVSDNMKPWQVYHENYYGSEKSIGIEYATQFFSVRAYIE